MKTNYTNLIYLNNRLRKEYRRGKNYAIACRILSVKNKNIIVCEIDNPLNLLYCKVDEFVCRMGHREYYLTNVFKLRKYYNKA